MLSRRHMTERDIESLQLLHSTQAKSVIRTERCRLAREGTRAAREDQPTRPCEQTAEKETQQDGMRKHSTATDTKPCEPLRGSADVDCSEIRHLQ